MEKIPLILLVTILHFYLLVGILAKRREKIVTMFDAPLDIEWFKGIGMLSMIGNVFINFMNILFLILDKLVTYFPRNAIAFFIAISWMNKTGILTFVEQSIDSKSYIDVHIVKFLRFLNRYTEKYYLSAVLYFVCTYTVEPSLRFENAAFHYFGVTHFVRMDETTKRANSDYCVPYYMYILIQSSHWVCLFYGIYLLGKCYEKSGIEYDILALLFNLVCCAFYVYAVYCIFVVFEIHDMVDFTITVIFSLGLIYVPILIMYRFRCVSGRIFLFGCAMFFTNYLIQEIHRYHESNTYEMRVISSANLILLAYITNYISLDHTYGFPLNLKDNDVFGFSLMKRLEMHWKVFIIYPLQLAKFHIVFKSLRCFFGMDPEFPNYIDFLVIMILRVALFYYEDSGIDFINCALLKQKWHGSGVFGQLFSSWFLFMLYVTLTIKAGIDWNFVPLDVFAIEIGILSLQLSCAHPTSRQVFSVWFEMKKFYYAIKDTFKGKDAFNYTYLYIT